MPQNDEVLSFFLSPLFSIWEYVYTYTHTMLGNKRIPGPLIQPSPGISDCSSVRAVLGLVIFGNVRQRTQKAIQIRCKSSLLGSNMVRCCSKSIRVLLYLVIFAVLFSKNYEKYFKKNLLSFSVGFNKVLAGRRCRLHVKSVEIASDSFSSVRRCNTCTRTRGGHGTARNDFCTSATGGSASLYLFLSSFLSFFLSFMAWSRCSTRACQLAVSFTFFLNRQRDGDATYRMSIPIQHGNRHRAFRAGNLKKETKTQSEKI
jgi:hypothetical protein